ncbi:hypothetical protein NDU88_001985 [Pleurodeles waltl]|uniref:Uncharacterized protein n=1 Tax=Pleurodeles waltl TaxID=8319 RepID=A0AAV7W218_PLEWA|nr:hypothetical protein NDU88_001985 [Pleurodeles waltl]
MKTETEEEPSNAGQRQQKEAAALATGPETQQTPATQRGYEKHENQDSFKERLGKYDIACFQETWLCEGSEPMDVFLDSLKKLLGKARMPFRWPKQVDFN